MSATCQAYTDFILATAATGSYATLVAALLPCHWVYQDVGARLCGAVENIDEHPYGDWIAAYADPEFAAVVDQARQIANTTAESESEGAAVREQMLSAFVQASRYEWMFWDAALHDSRWPIPT
ncbi:MAG: hypothetical protein CSB46_10455 [Micrococcales bacterium]|nr:MAG: hypothetical protein CSB46_10455 [Micrococcales bacterium]